MRNLTEYNDQFILNLIKQVKGNPYKCTANVQYAVRFNKLIPVLCVYQDYSKDWEMDDRCIFCEDVALLDFCSKMNISLDDAKDMITYYRDIAFQHAVNDIEYEQECFDKERQYDEWMAEELEWYRHARMMGWE